MDLEQLSFGKFGAHNVDTSLGAETGNWYAVQMIGETVISAITASGDTGVAITGTYADGYVLYGAFTSITVTSGIARCYNARPTR